MRHEPSALEGHTKHPMKLVRAHALLAGTHQVDRGQPLDKGNVAVGEDRTHGNGELLTARGALVDTLAGVSLSAFLWLQLVGFADDSAVRTDRAIRPALGFQHFT